MKLPTRGGLKLLARTVEHQCMILSYSHQTITSPSYLSANGAAALLRADVEVMVEEKRHIIQLLEICTA